MRKSIHVVTIWSLISIIQLLPHLSCFPLDIDSKESPLETSTKLSRKQLCPSDKSSSSFRYHQDTKACYKVGDKGPCGKNMVFYSEVNSTVYGECDCDFSDARVPLVYHPEKDECFQIYSQAFCEPSQWLVFTENKADHYYEPACVEDSCRDILLFDPEDLDPMIVEFNGKCVPINSKNPQCQSDQIVTFFKDQVVPTCGKMEETDKFDISNRLVYKTKSLSCRPGSRRDVTGKCRRSVTIKRPSESE